MQTGIDTEPVTSLYIIVKNLNQIISLAGAVEVPEFVLMTHFTDRQNDLNALTICCFTKDAESVYLVI